MRLRTTTWPCRSLVQLRAIVRLAAESGFRRPVVLDVGPGGMSRIGRSLHPVGRGSTWTAGERVNRGFGRLSDIIARTNPWGRVTSPETEELYLATLALDPSRLVFVDSEKRVLDAGRRFARQVAREELFEFRQLDVVHSEIGLTADIVVCFAMLYRTSDQDAARRHICAAVRPGGLLDIDGNGVLPGFVHLGGSLYRKDGGPP